MVSATRLLFNTAAQILLRLSNDGVSSILTLSWDASEGATSYNVYLDDGLVPLSCDEA